MKPMRKILSMLIVLVIFITTLPVVSAETTGTTADGLIYTVEDGNVTINGYTGEANEVVIPEEIGGNTVTTIGEAAFRYCTNVTKVTIPNTVTTIADEAFYCSYSVKELNLPKALNTIGKDAFYNSAIEAIEIPNDTFVLSDYSYNAINFKDEYLRARTGVFGSCKNLKTITFAEGIVHIPDNLFAGCTGLESVTIPETVKSIGENAFSYCFNLKELSLPEGLSEIQIEAFANCLSLKEVKLPQTLQKLGICAFGYSGLESVNIPASLDEIIKNTLGTSFPGVTMASSPGPFYRCENLKNVTFEKGITEIIPHLFTGTLGLEKVTLPEGIEKVGRDAFMGCSSINELNLPESLTIIESYAFAGTASLKEIKLPKNLAKIGEGIFQNAAFEEIEIPASLKEAEGDNFSNYYEKEDIKARIAHGPFYLCNNLKKVTFEDTADEIVDFLFAGAYGLEEVEFNGNIKAIGQNAFSGCISLKEFTFPETVKSVGQEAFMGCIGLEKIRFENPDTTIGSYIFMDCFALNYTKLPENIKTIPYASFMNCTSLETIEFPESVTEISSAAFCMCSSLDEITIPETLNEIHSNCFAGCSSLTSVVIPESIHSIDFGAFRNCTSLKDVKFTDYTVKVIWSDAFEGCSTLDEIILPKGLSYIDEGVFDNCQSLVKAVVPYSVTTIKERAFTGDKVTIYSREGSIVHQFAIDNHLKFVNDYIPATAIEYIGENPVFVENSSTYTARFKLTPENSTEIITLKSDTSDVDIRLLSITPLRLKDTATITATLENGNSCSFQVCSRQLSCIEISSLPDKTEYIPGEAIDTTGLTVLGTYSNGDTEEITDYTLEGFSSAESGFVTVTVKHKDFTADFKVRIMSKALLGDVNLDGKVSIKDATAIQKHLAKIAELSDSNLKAADVNADNTINIKDATEIQKYIANILDPDKTSVGKEIYI